MLHFVPDVKNVSMNYVNKVYYFLLVCMFVPL
jgi:hypothetical protein